MFETMQEYQGVGLAAPQVHESVRLFVAGFAPRRGRRGRGRGRGRRVPLMALINPEITVVGDDTADDWEGCLSIPDIRGRVTRAREIKVKAYDRRGRRIEITARNFTARVIQHETDHLDGVLFFDRMESFETLTFLDEFSRYWSSAPRTVTPGATRVSRLQVSSAVSSAPAPVSAFSRSSSTSE